MNLARLRGSSAFSLVELMVTVTIISILATLALPAYYTMVRNVHRVEAAGLLSDVYGMEQSFFASNNRYGCFTEIGFRMEGQGHFAIWICDDTTGCKNGVCPCVAAPDDWIAPSGGGVAGIGFVPGRVTLGMLAPPMFPGILPGGNGNNATPQPIATATSPANPANPWGQGSPGLGANPFVSGGGGGGGPALPVDLPQTCAALEQAQVFEAGADNWCRRAIPQVVDIYWLATETGKTVYYDPLPQDPADMSLCQ